MLYLKEKRNFGIYVKRHDSHLTYVYNKYAIAKFNCELSTFLNTFSWDKLGGQNIRKSVKIYKVVRLHFLIFDSLFQSFSNNTGEMGSHSYPPILQIYKVNEY